MKLLFAYFEKKELKNTYFFPQNLPENSLLNFYDFIFIRLTCIQLTDFCIRFQPDEITLLQFGLAAPQNSQINDGSQQQNANSQNSPVYRESRGAFLYAASAYCVRTFIVIFVIFFSSLHSQDEVLVWDQCDDRAIAKSIHHLTVVET